MANTSIPWVEKYRPTNINDIVLDDVNKQIMNNIISTKYFPNLLLYGPPGTGKTTTIMNLVNSYQNTKKGLMIHLNASDERGIDIIRSQIYQFVNSKSLFEQGTKFVILDEIDYMTKNAQHALKYLLQTYKTNNIRFCLICNYISRIDDSLQNEFIRLRFNQLPKDKIIHFLSEICIKEKIDISSKILKTIQNIYRSDIRSMINFLQSNHYLINNNNVIDITIWNKLFNMLYEADKEVNFEEIRNYIFSISTKYNIEQKNIIYEFCNYIVRNKDEFISSKLLQTIEYIIHSPDTKQQYLVNYALYRFSSLFKCNTLQ
jgi:DNA polymerase III delta prime subunit